jgi:myo-inositol-1-phosphate synthase
MLVEAFKVDSPNVHYGEHNIASTYRYQHTEVDCTADGKWVVTPKNTTYEFDTDTKVPKLG